MALWTCGAVLYLGYSRYAAVTRREVPAGYYKTYNLDKGRETEKLVKLGQHVENLFEAPPLFYAACVVLFLIQHVTWFTVVVAWAYVACRVAHTVVHVGHNNVMHRFQAYLSSHVCLIALWGSAMVQLLGA
jgi:hypothetical protein